VNNYMMSPRRVGATAGARARHCHCHENMNRALNPGEFFTFEEFQSNGQSDWTCLESSCTSHQAYLTVPGVCKWTQGHERL
jgi:hypothetical protein